MKKAKSIVTVVSISLLLVWIAGCGGCKKPAVLQGVSPSEGPETGGTTVRLTGENFAEGATVTFESTPARNVNIVSKLEISAVTPGGPVGSVNVTVANPEVEDKENTGTLGNAFTYKDATPPTISSVTPSDGTMVEEYEDSLVVSVPISVTYSESVTGVNISVDMATNSDALRQESGPVAGSVNGSGTTYTFTPDAPYVAGRKYTVTVTGGSDAEGNALAGTKTFSFTIKTPERVKWYTIKKSDGRGVAALKKIASRPETYDDESHWGWLVEANQDDAMIDRFSAVPGLRIVVPWWDK